MKWVDSSELCVFAHCDPHGVPVMETGFVKEKPTCPYEFAAL